MLLTNWLQALRQRPIHSRRSVRAGKHLRPLTVIGERLEDRTLLSAPEVSNLQLVDDTHTPGDLITSDPRVEGDVSDPDETADPYSLIVEYDYDGDGFADGEGTVDGLSGTFEVDLSGEELTSGETVYLQIRAAEYDYYSSSYLYGDWESFEFTYDVYGGAGNTPPEVSSLQLVDDTHTPGDLITSDPRVEGDVSDPDETADPYSLIVEYDYDGDLFADGAETTDSAVDFETGLTGEFSLSVVTTRDVRFASQDALHSARSLTVPGAFRTFANGRRNSNRSAFAPAADSF